MPPRIQARPVSQPSAPRCLRAIPQSHAEPIHVHRNGRSFHTSPRNETRLRKTFFTWLNGPGSAFKDPLPGSTNYLSAYNKEGRLIRVVNKQRQREREEEEEEGDDEARQLEEDIVQKELDEGLDDVERAERATARAGYQEALKRGDGKIPRERASDLAPYPLNPNFRSQPVLSEELREEIYIRVTVHGMDIATASSLFGVDMRRIAACVRLKTIEKQWEKEGKWLARPYARAVLAMLPKTPFIGGKDIVPHEPINDLPVHPHTRKQIFYPTSESRHFTREDAAKVFHPKLLPADERIAHPTLIQMEKWKLQQLSRDDRYQKLAEMDAKAEAEIEMKAKKEAEWKERTQRTVSTRRWDFVFQDVSADKVGKDGRSRQGVGYRYGIPLDERKRGKVKIPTSV